MSRWEFVIEVDRERRIPLYLQIARAISDEVRAGRLRAGDPLPGSRTLARTLGVQRLTVVSAFDELAAEGWIETQPARGTFISSALPDPEPRRFSEQAVERHRVPTRVRFDLPAAPPGEMPYDVPRGAALCPEPSRRAARAA
jgi:GntR family transcriptional regulator/MocR family aminotransferase